MYIEVKATDTETWQTFPSKAAMKRLMAQDVRYVTFISVGDVVGNKFSGTADQIPAGVKLSVVGPDPFTSRKWYGTVEIKNGKVRVS